MAHCRKIIDPAYDNKDPGGSDGKESACNAGDRGFNLWVRKIPRRREWQPMPVFLPREFHGQRSLEGCGSWGHKESDTIEQLTHTRTKESYRNDITDTLHLAPSGGPCVTLAFSLSLT